jgi:hypothetical protein
MLAADKKLHEPEKYGQKIQRINFENISTVE